jgi:hypothetical protein
MREEESKRKQKAKRATIIQSQENTRCKLGYGQSREESKKSGVKPREARKRCEREEAREKGAKG